MTHEYGYYSLSEYCKKTYGEKLYRISLDAGMTCPNRDGTLGTGGCIFCSAGGSGDFAVRPNACDADSIVIIRYQTRDRGSGGKLHFFRDLRGTSL